jgi:beta-D-xylosidase 4
LIQSARGVIENAPFATFDIRVTNTGGPAHLASDYVDLLFISTDNAGPAPYPLKSLAGYGRVFNVGVGQIQTLSVQVFFLEALARADVDGNFVICPGDYSIAVGLRFQNHI